VTQGKGLSYGAKRTPRQPTKSGCGAATNSGEVDRKMINHTAIHFHNDRLKEIQAILDKLAPHEHGDGMNECHICDQPLDEAILLELRKLVATPVPPSATTHGEPIAFTDAAREAFKMAWGAYPTCHRDTLWCYGYDAGKAVSKKKKASSDHAKAVPQNELAARSYDGSDMLSAWLAGRSNYAAFGDAEGDVPDFASWIRDYTRYTGDGNANQPVALSSSKENGEPLSTREVRELAREIVHWMRAHPYSSMSYQADAVRVLLECSGLLQYPVETVTPAPNAEVTERGNCP